MAKLHRTELPYDPTPRAIAQAASLPLDAVGVWVWARSLPDGTDVSVDAVIGLRRGLGVDRATRAVQALRAHGLWHTLTYRGKGGLVTSCVVVPPEPWTRERAAEVLGLDPAQLVEGPSDRRHLRAVSAGRTDTRVSEDRSTEDRSTEGRPTDHRSPGGDSLEQRERTTPQPPLRGGVIDGCQQGHRRAVRGCCSRRDVQARRRAAADAAERETARARLVELAPPAGDDAAGIAAARAELARVAARRRSDP